MAEQQRDTEAQNETQAPQHSPVEEEFAGNEGDTPAPRDGVMIAGYSAGIVIAAVFILFLVAAVIALVVA
jgi:hypothetical protein